MKHLLALALILPSIACAERSMEDYLEEQSIVGEYVNCTTEPGRVDNVAVSFFWFTSLKALRKHFDDDTLEGYSECERYSTNFAHCDIYAVMPKIVDGEFTLTLGHELMHGICGQKFHGDQQ